MRFRNILFGFLIIFVSLSFFYISIAQTEAVQNANFTSDSGGWIYGETDSSGVASGSRNETGGHYDDGVYLMIHNDSDIGTNPTSVQWINYSFNINVVPKQAITVVWYRLNGSDSTDYHSEVRLIHSNGTEFTINTSQTYTTGGFDSGWIKVTENTTKIIDATGTFVLKLLVETKAAPLNSDIPDNFGFWDDVQIQLYYPPKYYDNSTNDTSPYIGKVVDHRVRWTDDSDLSYAVIEINSTGASCDTKTNQSSTTLSGTEDWSNFTWTIPSTCEGKTIGWVVYANDTNNYWNKTDLQVYDVEIDNEKPFYYKVSSNDSSPFTGYTINFSFWTDNVELDYWTFSWNASGTCDTWENITLSSFSETTNSWSNITQQVPLTCEGAAVGWRFYANDTSGNLNVTQIGVLDVQQGYITITLYNDPVCFGSVDAGSEYEANSGSIPECGADIDGFPLIVEIESNVNTVLWFNGTGDLTDGSNILDLSNLRFNESSSPSIKTGLSTNYYLFEEGISTGQSNHSSYWWINIPTGQAAGSSYSTIIYLLVNRSF